MFQTPSRKSYVETGSDSERYIESGEGSDSEWQMSDFDEQQDYVGFEEMTEIHYLSDERFSEEEEEEERLGRRAVRARSGSGGGGRRRARRRGLGRASSSHSRSPIATEGGGGERDDDDGGWTADNTPGDDCPHSYYSPGLFSIICSLPVATLHNGGNK